MGGSTGWQEAGSGNLGMDHSEAHSGHRRAVSPHTRLQGAQQDLAGQGGWGQLLQLLLLQLLLLLIQLFLHGVLLLQTLLNLVLHADIVSRLRYHRYFCR